MKFCFQPGRMNMPTETLATLANKRILLGMTGGIAAYKCAELTRLLTKAGATVKVVMTAAATEFMTPLTMQALSGHKVHLDLLDADAEAGMGHIELARWPDLVLVAPASADFMARLASGQADDLLTTLLLATPAPVALAPAMNQGMWSKPGTQANLTTLREQGIHFFGPDSGIQACGDTGPGRMQEPEALAASCASLFPTNMLSGRHLLITGGPTREAIDPVRYISNHSSGKMAYALAEEAVLAGARVTLVSGPVNLAVPDRVSCLFVDSAQQMLAACEQVLDQQDMVDAFIGVAAVADYRVAQVSEQKIKKQDEEMVLRLVRNPDILATVAERQERPFMVGFAAETENLLAHAGNKVRRKKLDLIFANDASATFNSDAAAAVALWPMTGEDKLAQQSLGPATKSFLARQMLTLISERLLQREAND
tara:strand:- start:1978 stop:3255 length:1278 start_codon:yes stop_codon:yes gene_type:complete